MATTISFNMPTAQVSRFGDATAAINDAMRQIGMPASIHGSFMAGHFGALQTFTGVQLNSEPILIAAALIAVYIVLGVLYESYIHPITILSTLPSAGVGAHPWRWMPVQHRLQHHRAHRRDLAHRYRQKERDHDDRLRALEAERNARHGAARSDLPGLPVALLRQPDHDDDDGAAMLGALPLALSFGDGAELRQPLGISIVGQV